ncbi:zinc finger, C2H2 type, partial [Necator americanus]
METNVTGDVLFREGTHELKKLRKPLNISRCTLCKSSKGDLHACIQCHKLYHLRQCILYPEAVASNAEKRSWLCPKCVLCAACNLMIDDPSNVECATCLRAWHGACMPTNGKVLYNSPYPEHIKSVPLFFVCSFCLKPFSERDSFFVHQDYCPRVTPPGREIYRDATSSLSFFEVDGAEERTYCRNLCLLAMQFLAWKTRHSEIATFLFYILTRNEEDGCRIVGYFSKEKNPSRNYNLSCLLTLPSEQRCGYGQLLIDMSYQLSKIERKVGGPERPLSDRGLLTYRKYWRSSILCYLRSVKDSHSISLKNMSLATRIHPTDIVNQLLHDNLLVMKDENYFFRTWKMPHSIRLSESEMKDTSFDAARSFVAIEEETQRWGKWIPSKNLIATGHIATVDALRLFASRGSSRRFCLSGGRDRAIKLWSIDDLQASQSTSAPTKPCVDIQNAHEGWIWCLDQSNRIPDQFLSCSWDCTVKLWQITPTSVEPLESTKLGSAGMCLGNTPDGLAACSTFGKK